MRSAVIKQNAAQAAEFISSQLPLALRRNIRFGIILGTGAGRLADDIQAEVSLDYHSVPHLPASTALGHKGQFVFGTLAGQNIVAMQGRFHLYEGYDINQATLPIHIMQRLGVNVLLVSNASGGLNPKMKSGDLMMIDSHIDLMFRASHGTPDNSALDRPALSNDAYDQEMIQNAMACGRLHGFAVHRGVYAALLGPNYETRAEYRMLKRIGADVAGMSTVPEVTVAARCGIRVLGISVVTNIANPDSLKPTSGQLVIDAAESAAPNLKTIVLDAMGNLRDSQSA